jgi:hypothetical protein
MESLPAIIEDYTAAYLTSHYTGAYNILKKLSIEEYELPAIAVGIGNLAEYEPNTGVYGGRLSLVVLTQIDETEQDLSTHDRTVQDVYDLILSDDFLTYFNSQSTGHIWCVYDVTIEEDRQDRVLIGIIELSLYAQLLATA